VIELIVSKLGNKPIVISTPVSRYDFISLIVLLLLEYTLSLVNS